MSALMSCLLRKVQILRANHYWSFDENCNDTTCCFAGFQYHMRAPATPSSTPRHLDESFFSARSIKRAPLPSFEAFRTSTMNALLFFYVAFQSVTAVVQLASEICIAQAVHLIFYSSIQVTASLVFEGRQGLWLERPFLTCINRLSQIIALLIVP